VYFPAFGKKPLNRGGPTAGGRLWRSERGGGVFGVGKRETLRLLLRHRWVTVPACVPPSGRAAKALRRQGVATK
jgi:hypothetical protein